MYGIIIFVARAHAIVVGGGLAGLATSIALTHVGVDVRRVAPELASPRADGASPRRAFQLWSNAVAALEHLGVRLRARARAGARALEPFHRLDLVEIRAYSGELLWTLPVGPWSGEIPSGMVWEDDLLAILRGVAPGGSASICDRVRSVRDDGARVHVVLESGAHLTADIVVGADGRDSRVRELLLGRELPRALGQVMCIGTTPTSELGDTSELGPGRLLGPGRAFATQAADRRFWAVRMDDEVYWMATVMQELVTTAASQPEWPATLQQLFRHAPGPVTALVNRGLISEPFLVCDRPPARTWVDGGVALLGDAAHPMTPDLGQGACLALEDAVVLADSLRRLGPRGGLAHYARERRTRADAVAALSHAMAASALPGERRQARLRDLLTPYLVPPIARRCLDELLSYRAPALEP